jgi:hypothetical protein
MTINEMFENSGNRKTIWTKRGGELSKRSTMAAVAPRTKFEQVKAGEQK